MFRGVLFVDESRLSVRYVWGVAGESGPPLDGTGVIIWVQDHRPLYPLLFFGYGFLPHSENYMCWVL